MNSETRGRLADATPLAAALIEGLRDIGYSLETALADVIDNAITARANKIEILTETAVDEPAIAVLDDGVGMTEAELIDAMRPGSRNPLEERDDPDLGRFGLGMKSASFSQCRRLTVISRKNGVTSGAVWDLDSVAKTNRWDIEVLDHPEEIAWTGKIGASGTLILWEKLDRLSGGYNRDMARRAEVINQRLAETERHIRLVDPAVIVVMGNTPLSCLCGEKGILRARGVWRTALGRPVLPMTHPAYLLRNPEAKREAWADLQALQERLRG